MKSNVLIKENIRSRFNRAALTYDAHAVIQPDIGKKLIALLNQYTFKSDFIIDLGCGTGTVTKNLIEKYAYKQFFAIDIADTLLLQAKDKLALYDINIHSNDFESFSYDGILFDLIFSNMALHWSSNLQNTFNHIAQQSSHHGIIAFSLPLTGTLTELETLSINAFYSSKSVLKLLKNAGLKILETHYASYVLPFDSWIAALKSIKGIGANYILQQNHASLRGKGLSNRLLVTLSEINTAITLTYQVGFFIVRK